MKLRPTRLGVSLCEEKKMWCGHGSRAPGFMGFEQEHCERARRADS
jgi:hypothetical protein